MEPIILAIESSCDETSASICRKGIIISNVIATQQVHEQYGGVVPELASRAHLQNIVPVVQQALAVANVTLTDVDAFAYTQAPGLLGSLLVGAQYAKSLALACNKPLIEVHHMQAHVLANLIGDNPAQFPFLCLTVSGGHTQIVLAKSPYELELLGETIDDAVGEAFDKAAKLLGLPYPGGPLIDKYAQQGNPLAFAFARPNIADLNFSFSGVKTSILYFLRDKTAEQPNFIDQHLADICASIQHTLIDILMRKLKKAVTKTKIHRVCLAGGVSANSGLRAAMKAAGAKYGWKVHMPDFAYCTDNAGMIAITAHYKYLQQQFADLTSTPTARASW